MNIVLQLSWGRFASTETKRVSAPVPDIEAALPENHVLSNIRGMVGYSLQVPSGEEVVHIRNDQRCVLAHGREQAIEDLVAKLNHGLFALRVLAEINPQWELKNETASLAPLRSLPRCGRHEIPRYASR